MLVNTRPLYDEMLDAVRRSEVIAFDCEASGKYLRHGDCVVGISLYCSSNQQTYYIPIAHGYKDDAPTASPLDTSPRYGKISKTGKPGKLLKPKTPTQDQRLAWGMWLYQEQIQPGVRSANIPAEWLQELIDIWLMPKLHIAHNAPFDLTALETLGFPTPKGLQDTMSMVSVVNTDWRGNPREGIVTQFFMPDTKQYEQGSRRLKWLARQFGLEDATGGIDSLESAVLRLSRQIVDLGGGVALFTKPKPKKKATPAEVLMDLETGEPVTEDTLDEDSADVVVDDADELTEAAQAFIWMLHPSEVAKYAEDDTRLTYLLWRKVIQWLRTWKEVHLSRFANRATAMTWQMERHGFRLDTERAAEMITTGTAILETDTAKIYEMSGGWITKPASPKQVATYLTAIGVTTATTGKDDLNRVKDVPIIQPILAARSMAVMLHTYIEKWDGAAVHGYIHPALIFGGTGTLRLSSASKKFGNLQNIPRVDARSPINPKKLLCAPLGTVFIEIDYSTLEMRIAAWVAETLIGKGADMTLTNLVISGDVHAYTMKVSGIYDMLLDGKSEEEYLVINGYDMTDKDIIADPKRYFYSKIARMRAKTTNFAALYGAGERGIMRAVGCSQREAAVLIAGFRQAYPAAVEAMGIMEREALKPRKPHPDFEELYQFVRYPVPGLDFTRKYGWYPSYAVSKQGRPFSPIKSAARGAFNSVVQGTGGLIMLDSIIRNLDNHGIADYTLDSDNQRVYSFTNGKIIPMNTVHDSILLALLPEHMDIIPDVCKTMCDYPIYPSLGVDVSSSGVSGSWGDVKHVSNIEQWISSGGIVS